MDYGTTNQLLGTTGAGGLGGFDIGWVGLMIFTALIGFATQSYIKRTFARFSQVRTARGWTGAQVAEQILQDNNIHASGGAPTNRDSVGIIPTKGSLTDHYDPRKGIVALSETVYGQNSISANAVAAHEVGHALQTHHRYFFGEMRTRLVPIVNLTSSAAPFLIILGIMQPLLSGIFWLGIILYSGSVLFQLVTLPVEFNASRRALVQLEQSGALTPAEIPGARKVLTAAALTYLGAALVSILWLLRYIGMGRRS